MPEFEKNLFELHNIIGIERKFCANGFRVLIEEKSKLVTCAHVAFDGPNRRTLSATSHDGSEVIDSLVFQQRGFKDIAEHELSADQEGFELGYDEDLLCNPVLLLIHSTFNGYWKEKYKVRPVLLGGVSLEKNPRKSVNRRFENQVDVTSLNVKEVAYPGCSGSPLLTENGQVVGVLHSIYWNSGIQYSMCTIYTHETLRALI